MSDDLTLHEFIDRGLLEERDGLAFRQLLGWELSPTEKARLDELNETLDRLLPKSQPISPRVMQLVHEILGRHK